MLSMSNLPWFRAIWYRRRLPQKILPTQQKCLQGCTKRRKTNDLRGPLREKTWLQSSIVTKHLDYSTSSLAQNPNSLFLIIRETHLTNVSGGGTTVMQKIGRSRSTSLDTLKLCQSATSIRNTETSGPWVSPLRQGREKRWSSRRSWIERDTATWCAT